MLSTPRSLLLALAPCALFACTTMQSVTSTQRAAVVAGLESGDRVSVLTREGWHDNMIVVAVTEGSLSLKTWNDEEVTVERDAIWDLEVPVRSKHKTGALIGAATGAAILLWVLADTDGELVFDP